MYLLLFIVAYETNIPRETKAIQIRIPFLQASLLVICIAWLRSKLGQNCREQIQLGWIWDRGMEGLTPGALHYKTVSSKLTDYTCYNLQRIPNKIVHNDIEPNLGKLLLLTYPSLESNFHVYYAKQAFNLLQSGASRGQN